MEGIVNYLKIFMLKEDAMNTDDIYVPGAWVIFLKFILIHFLNGV